MKQSLLFVFTFSIGMAFFFIRYYDHSSYGNSMKFIEVAKSFDEIEPIAARLEITRLLADLLKKHPRAKRKLLHRSLWDNYMRRILEHSSILRKKT